MNAAPPPSPAVRKSGTPAWRRRLPWIGGLVLIALIVMGLWPKAVSVEVAAVTRGPLVVTVDEEGMTRVKQRYIVTAPVAGHLRRIDWKAGATVEAGKTPLAIIEAGEADFLDGRAQAQAEARVRGAEAARAGAAAQLARAEAAARMFTTDFERVKLLRDQKVLSAQEYDVSRLRAETATQDARAAVFAAKVAEFELEQAHALLIRGSGQASTGGSASRGNSEPLIVTPPVSGRILRIFQESARIVPAGFALLEIGDPTDLEVRIEVLSRDGVAIKPGSRVMLEQWGGAEPLIARVRHVEPAAFTKISALGVEEQRVYVIADFAETAERRVNLGDSFRVEAKIVVWEKSDTLRVPAGALFEQNGKWFAFAIEGGRARRNEVRIGYGNGTQTEVLEGLTEGQRVIIYPGDKVTDGTRTAALEVGAR